MFYSEGVFFAVKEVCLCDQGSNAQQCIFQLEQVGVSFLFVNNARAQGYNILLVLLYCKCDLS